MSLPYSLTFVTFIEKEEREERTYQGECFSWKFRKFLSQRFIITCHIFNVSVHPILAEVVMTLQLISMEKTITFL